jgi:hypothetical protein
VALGTLDISEGRITSIIKAEGISEIKEIEER